MNLITKNQVIKGLFFSLLYLFTIAKLLFGADPQGLVYVAIVDKDIDPGLSFFIRRVIKTGERDKVAAIILEINSPGGLVESCLEIKDTLLAAEVTTVGHVYNRALSAAALIAISCEKLAMKDESTIGAATPILLNSGTGISDASAKMVSAFRAEFKAAAEKRGRPPQICEAMVDKAISIPHVVNPGEILTLTTTRAVDLGVANYAINTRGELLEKLGFQNHKVVVFEPTAGERFARFITNMNVSSVLLGVGFWGLIAFFFAGSFMGLAGGIFCFGLVYGASFFAGISNPISLLFLFSAIILLLGEIFILPGFGLAGVSGILLLIVSICLNFETPLMGLLVFSKGIIISIIGLPIIWRMGGENILAHALVLKSKIDPESGFQDVVTGDMFTHLIGSEGVSVTPLRPGGTVKIDGKRFEAVSEGEFLEKEVHIKVISSRQNTLIVEELK